MKQLLRFCAAVATGLLLIGANANGVLAASTQTITLRPGWNAVYLEVQPEVRTPAEVFANLPVESVWTWFDRSTSVEFIRDPAEGLWAQPGWSAYTKDPAKSAAINLHAIFANRAYLIKMAGRQPVTWTITGKPATDRTFWNTNSFNLTGFHVNPANPPTFAEFLADSPAHAGQPVYRLSPLGVWELVATPAATTIKTGEAYWIYCNGASSYQGPVEAQIFGGELNYGTTTDLNSVTLANQSATSRTVVVKFLPAADWFTYQSYNATTGFYEYPRLDSWSVQLSANRQTNIWLAVRRELLATGIYEGNLEITDDVGTRTIIPVKVEKLAE